MYQVQLTMTNRRALGQDNTRWSLQRASSNGTYFRILKAPISNHIEVSSITHEAPFRCPNETLLQTLFPDMSH